MDVIKMDLPFPYGTVIFFIAKPICAMMHVLEANKKHRRPACAFQAGFALANEMPDSKTESVLRCFGWSMFRRIQKRNPAYTEDNYYSPKPCLMNHPHKDA